MGLSTAVSRWGLAIVLLTSPAAVRGEVVDITGENYSKVVDGSSNVLLEFYAPWCGHCKKLVPEYGVLGGQFSKERDGIIIAKVDSEKHAALAGMFDVSGFPTLKWMAKGKSLPGDAEAVTVKERTAASLGKFITEKTGVEPRVASQPPSAVLDLTVETFESAVMSPSKHALVEFFAPWCGHCKSLAPVWEKLGAVFSAENSVVVAKVDAVAEKDLGTRFGVTGFPSLKYFPPGDGDVEDYKGGRDLDSLVGFLNKKAGTFRNPDGGISAGAGRVPALDAVLASSSGSSPADLASRVDEAVAAAGYAAGSDLAASAGHYARAAKKIVDRGAGYVATELKRLEGLLSGGQAVSPQKRTLFMVRSNILKAFVEFGFGGEGGGEGEEAKVEL